MLRELLALLDLALVVLSWGEGHSFIRSYRLFASLVVQLFFR